MAARLEAELRRPPVRRRPRKVEPRSEVARLRRELAASRAAEMAVAEALRADLRKGMVVVVVPKTRSAALEYARRVALGRLEAMWERGAAGFRRSGFAAWRSYALRVGRSISAARLVRRRGAEKLVSSRLAKRPLRSAMRAWRRAAWALREVEEFRARATAAETAQRVARGKLGRDIAGARREARREKGALGLQAAWRGRAARLEAAAARQARAGISAATRISALWRGVSARTRVRQFRRFRRDIEAATRVQARWRARVARRRLRALRDLARRSEAALIVERLARGAAAREAARRRRHSRARRDAATAIQRLARGGLVRDRVAVLEAARDRRRAAEARAARRLGEFARRVARIRQARAERARARVRAWAAARIQARCARGPTARGIVGVRLVDRRRELFASARDCVETYEDGVFFYAGNPAPPPPTGYKRRDGMLVLATGAVVIDPEDAAADAERARRAAFAAAEHLLGVLGEQALASIQKTRDFLGGLDDLREFREPRFDAFCRVVRDLATELETAGNPPSSSDAVLVATEQARDEEADIPAAAATTITWEQYADDVGTPYYYNPETGESTYETPPQTQGGAIVPCEEPPTSTWGHTQEPTLLEQTTTSDDPTWGEREPTLLEQTTNYTTTSDDPNWVQSQDEEGRWYWYNTATGESYYDEYYYE
ncbi:hypothetical protein CTAYLR_005956 [Chrysophaeum taylorii]|uniref:WW domain-containing protein n=1 Tax=Chrysophaeum taylorii TaxID=2483200 RepID=A0AAD7UIT4_9STRA|nr:hypothetical protein CTAYLR_005956 [Chrysophaeum taylorii]